MITRNSPFKGVSVVLNRYPYLLGSSVLAIVFSGCLVWGIARLVNTPANAVTVPDGLRPYALDGALTWSEIDSLGALRYPQQYRSITSRYGYPAYRGAEADYYTTPDGGAVAIYYNGDAQATGYGR